MFIIIDLGGLFTSLKLFPFMYKGDISTGLDANELESGFYINGDFSNAVNSPFSSGWGGIVVFKTNSYYSIQFASEISSRKLKFRQRWNENWTNWMTVSLT